MTFPIVSRGRYDDRCAEVSELKAERQLLLDRIQMLQGQPPIFHRPEPLAATSEPASTNDKNEPVRSRATIDRVRAQANAAAEQAAREGSSLWKNAKPKVANVN